MRRPGRRLQRPQRSRAHPAIHVFQWDRDPGPMFLSPCGDAFAHLPAVKLTCDGLFASRVAFRMPARGDSDPRGIYLNLLMIFHRPTAFGRAVSWKMEQITRS